MCYNCGCGIPNDEMGKGAVHNGGGSLTQDSFEHMAKIWSMTVADAKKNVLEMLKGEEIMNKK